MYVHVLAEGCIIYGSCCVCLLFNISSIHGLTGGEIGSKQGRTEPPKVRPCFGQRSWAGIQLAVVVGTGGVGDYFPLKICVDKICPDNK